MLRKALPLALAFCAGHAALAADAWIDPVLEDKLEAALPNSPVNAYVILQDQVDLDRAIADARARSGRLADRHFEVISRAQALARRTQGPLLEALEAGKRGQQVERFTPFWISNAVALRAQPAFIRALASRADISAIYFDYPIELIRPEGELRDATDATNSVENGVVVSGATELWAIGIDGTGTLACDQDTGADGNHPALAGRWRGLDEGVDPGTAWFDPIYNETFPSDSDVHGTHTMGTILGDDGADNQIGMAPGAHWIGAKTIDVPNGNIFSDAVAAFQWAADPDGDATTMDDVPDVINNSWGLSIDYYGPCLSDFNAAIDTAEAAGVVVIFAAGNEGSSGPRSPASTITTELNTFAIGALNEDNSSIASFSSRGPSSCDGVTIKPEISAVGVNVRSSVPGGGYANYDGTSMASPHVSGAVLLLRQAFPDATPEDIKTALYQTAIDLGSEGEDNSYGMGAMDVYAAYLFLEQYMVNSEGKVRTGELYSCDDEISITVADIDLTGPGVDVTVSSSSESTPETVALYASATAGTYKGTIPTNSGTATPGDGYLTVSDSDVITVTYVDADDGNGNQNVTRTAEATTDCAAPVFDGLSEAIPGDFEVALGWNAASDAHGVSYNIYRSEGSNPMDYSSPIDTVSDSPYTDQNVVNGTTYTYGVRAVDSIGNESANTETLTVTPVGPDRIFTDDFEAGDDLAQWTLNNGGRCPATWYAEDCGGAEWCEGTLALVDHGECLPWWKQDEQMISPPIDCSGFSGIELRFTHYFDQGSKEIADVDYSFDNRTWTNVQRYRRDSATGEVTIDLPELDGQPQVYIRFRYYNTGMASDDWGIDNIELVGWAQ